MTKVSEDVHEAFDSELLGLRERWTEARKVWDSLEDDLRDTCGDIEAELRDNPPAPFEPPPHPEASEPDSTEVLFDSRRDYLTQCDRYKAWQGGAP